PGSSTRRYHFRITFLCIASASIFLNVLDQQIESHRSNLVRRLSFGVRRLVAAFASGPKTPISTSTSSTYHHRRPAASKDVGAPTCCRLAERVMDYRDCVLFRYFAAGSLDGAVRDKSIVTQLTQQYICDGTRILGTYAGESKPRAEVQSITTP